ncbi:hypothetical protein C8J57DRAFT_1355165 [Mycena rebaudengoi]|nr:hypothetical protein C8J57DRAFT_1355165 [Mycena rebaudengoi]
MRLTFWDSESLTVALDLLQTWLLRSRDYPLSISLDAEDLGDAREKATEWNANLHMPHTSLRLLSCDFPILHRLRLGISHARGDTSAALTKVPRLKHVVLARSFWPADFQLFPDECLGILQDAHALVHFAATKLVLDALTTPALHRLRISERMLGDDALPTLSNP